MELNDGNSYVMRGEIKITDYGRIVEVNQDENNKQN